VFAGDGQTFPHVLQLLGSNATLVQSPPHCVVPPVHTSEHTPPTHDWPPVHAFPQAPQLALSVLLSLHTPLQFTCVPGHETEQTPALQTLPLAQLVPAVPLPTPQPAVAPQCVRSVAGSTHTPPQFTCPPGHETEHTLALHTLPLAQVAPALPPVMPQPAVAPQWVRSVTGSTQTPPQFTCPPGHDTEHAPELHTLPLAQLVPALPTPSPQPVVAPQCVRSLEGSTQTPPQLTCVPGHETEQRPELQTFPLAQVAPAVPPERPQPVVAPQCVRSLVGSTHTPPQLTCEPGHETEQEPELHTLPLGQVAPALPPERPQPVVAPQCVRSLVGSTHTPPQLTCEPGHETEHAPELQTLPLAHVAPAVPTPLMPQPVVAPQCVRSVTGSTQTPPQFTCVPGHETEHVPELHTLPLAHAVPALPPAVPQPAVAPQCVRSVEGFTQTPPQLTCEPGHETEHVPELHTLPLAHAVPALPPLIPQPLVAPQCVRSVVGSTHTPPQLTCEPGHETEQEPELQTLPLGQLVPALPAPPMPQPVVAPQWVRSLVGSTHTPPQLTCEPGHETEQEPELQTLPLAQVAPAVPAPPMPQPAVAPQWLRSVVGSTQTPPQFTCDPAHVTLHLLPLQTWPEGHLVPQAPQLLLSVVTSRQTPLQLVVPAPQETLHVLPLQICPDAHLVPQAPQLLLSVVTSRQTPLQLVVPVPHETLHLLALQT
jgi:hypothetical protein